MKEDFWSRAKYFEDLQLFRQKNMIVQAVCLVKNGIKGRRRKNVEIYEWGKKRPKGLIS